MNKKTKIICTMGPNTDDRNLMLKLAQNGMDIARFNFSHGTYPEQKERMDQLKNVRQQVNKPIAILLDTKGPEIRTGVLKEKSVTLVEGQTFILTAEEIEGDNERVSITYPELVNDVKPGNTILIDDGLLGLVVDKIEGNDIICTVQNGGTLSNRKGVNVPNVKINLPPITEKDRADIIFGIGQGIDFIAASFVRNADAIHEIRKILKDHGADEEIHIIAKIENQEGVDNIDSILEAADGIMVARGDLGVEIPEEEVPYVQKMLIQKCNDAFKPVITATQMLDSMIRNPRATRAEVTDIANAIYDGTDAIMLSGETAMGKYPLEALNTMVNIAKFTESKMDYDRMLELKRGYRSRGISTAVAYAAVATARNLDATALIVSSAIGFSAKMLSKFKPKAGIIAITPYERTQRRMQIYWGVTSYITPSDATFDEVFEQGKQIALEKGISAVGDAVILASGSPNGLVKGANTNLIKVDRLK